LNKNNYGGKYQKWKVEVVWYEPDKEEKARLIFDDPDYAKRVLSELSNKPNLE
jgi:hypothetical protein